MGSKNKLKRFKENESFANVIQPTRESLLADDFQYKGNWSAFFGNSNPIVVELGCGKGEYSVGLARKNPNVNYIGIDIKGARFWRGAKTALEEKLPNVAFVRTQIELVTHVFAPAEVSELWITFPDPQYKFKRTHHRLTNPNFLKKYKQILKPNGIVHLKTDAAFLHGYTLGVLDGWNIKPEMAHHDVYQYVHAPADVIGIQTFYEQQYRERGIPITYLKFLFPTDDSIN
ncbi:MAG: tRNA (guanosine(46)-N7)-methyltransferase TrmB [Flavobacteriaceae bacterium]